MRRSICAPTTASPMHVPRWAGIWTFTTPSARIRAWRPARPTKPTSALRRSARLREFPAGVGEVVDKPGASPPVDLWTTQERCPQPELHPVYLDTHLSEGRPE